MKKHEILKQIRRDSGLSQLNFAKKLVEVAIIKATDNESLRQRISALENNRQSLSTELLNKIANVFGSEIIEEISIKKIECCKN